MSYCLPFSSLCLSDTALVGGKNAALGELIRSFQQEGILIPDGFALSTDAYRLFLSYNHLAPLLEQQKNRLDTESLSNLSTVAETCRRIILSGEWPPEVECDIRNAYQHLTHSDSVSVAVRSSASAEDLPHASFAGQHDSFLHIIQVDMLLQRAKQCYASLFNDRAIKYRLDQGMTLTQAAMSVGVQKMVRAENGSSGVAFTLEPESGSANIIYITSVWGLGESIVQGIVNPDEFYLFKPLLSAVARPVIRKRLGEKKYKTVPDASQRKSTIETETTPEEQNNFSLSEEMAVLLAKQCALMESRLGYALDIEWAVDGVNGKLFIVQARPETVFSGSAENSIKTFTLTEKAEPICRGKAVGQSIVSGSVCKINSLDDTPEIQPGDILVADSTNPDWNALLKKAACIVTNKGGRTSHAAIVARERGIPAVVGTANATALLQSGQIVTVSCAEGDVGKVYDGKLKWEETLYRVSEVTPTQTKAMLIVSDPDKAFHHARLPAQGVGLLRLEFIISDRIGIHPMALAKFEEMPDSETKEQIRQRLKGENPRVFFIRELSEAIALFGAAFYPREVIVRMSDFKSNEYEKLLGGKGFELPEENPMLGFRGASRYDHPRYREGFQMECEAMRRVRTEMGLSNIKLMIPFCRTLREGRRVISRMKEYGLEQKKGGLQIYVMAEIPSNVLLAKSFADIFDGFSIGSNDLTQLVLGVDRDAEMLAGIFDENDPAVRKMIRQVIQSAHAAGKPVGLCGQAPSDHPGFAEWLVTLHIDNISFSPDAFLRGLENIRNAEIKTPKKIIV